MPLNTAVLEHHDNSFPITHNVTACDNADSCPKPCAAQPEDDLNANNKKQ